MTGRSVLADAEARRRAATDFETNLVVQAGAGTGKTSLLVERVLNAVGLGRVEIDRIAAITFTEKAAGEMRQRMAEGLEELRRLARGVGEVDTARESGRAFIHLVDEVGLAPEQLASRALRALERLDRATITTIHAFCADLLRRHPREAEIDPDFAIDQGEQRERLLQESWDGFLQRELGPRAERAELWREVLDAFGPGLLREVAVVLAGWGFPEQLLGQPGICAAPSQALRSIGDELRADLDRALPPAAKLPSKLGVAYFAAVRGCLDALISDGTESMLEAFERAEVLASRNGPYAPNRDGDGFIAAELKAISGRFWKLVDALQMADDELAGRAVEAVLPWVLEFREASARQGWIDFDGLLAQARRLLLEQPAIRRRVKRRFELLLVDEFQDTDPLQYDIVLLLAERVAGEASDPYLADLEPGRLFIVGDPKQSIYRFRGADYAAFAEAVARVLELGGVRLDLVSNFRSVAGVVDPVNALFVGDRSAWIPSARQPDYVPIVSARPDEGGEPRVELWSLVADDKPNADERRHREGRVLAEAIARGVREKRFRHREVAILFRAFGSVTIYLRALREFGVPFVIDGGKEFLKRPEVAQFVATLRSVAEPSDGPALLAYLRSPSGAVTDRELALYGSGGALWDWRLQPDATRFPRIAAGFARLRELAEVGRDRPADGWIREVLRRTKMLPLAAAGFEGPQRVANLQKVAAAAERLARGGQLSLTEVVESITEGRLAELDSESPLADDRADAVRVTSIHRMKGLESPWVFLPDLARGRHAGTNRSVTAGLLGGRTDRRLALSIGGIHSTAWVVRTEEDRQHDQAEEARVLYVAATRAREKLVLLTDDTEAAAPWKAALAPWGYLPGKPVADGSLDDGRVRLLEVSDPGPRPRPQFDPDPVPEEWPAAYQRATDRVRQEGGGIEAPSGAESAPDAPFESGEPSGPVAVDDRDRAQAVGNAVHRSLEDWDGSPERLRVEAGPHAVAAARERGVEPEAIEQETLEILESFLRSKLAERFRALDLIGRELPLLWNEEGRHWRGTLDLLGREPDGDLVLVDFKTDRAPDAERLRRRYTAPLRIYASAVREALGLDESPRIELWALRTGEAIVVDP